MTFYSSSSKQAILYHAQVMAGSWGYRPEVYANRMGWIDQTGRVTEKGHRLAKWMLDAQDTSNKADNHP